MFRLCQPSRVGNRVVHTCMPYSSTKQWSSWRHSQMHIHTSGIDSNWWASRTLKMLRRRKVRVEHVLAKKKVFACVYRGSCYERRSPTTRDTLTTVCRLDWHVLRSTNPLRNQKQKQKTKREKSSQMHARSAVNYAVCTHEYGPTERV